MPISEAISVLGLEDKELSFELIDERHQTMLDINNSGNHQSPYIIAKINNAKAAAIEQFKNPEEIIQEEIAKAEAEKKSETKTEDKKPSEKEAK